MIKPWAVCLISVTTFSLHAQFSFTNRSSRLAHNPVYSGVAIGVADMNSDGLDDIVRIDQSSKMMIDYQPAVQNQFTGYQFGQLLGKQWSMCIADVDSNGFNDVFTGGNNNGLKLLKANSTGAAYTLTTITQNPIFLQGSNFADIDNDGDADLFACHDNGKSQPFRNNGAGQFTLDYTLIDAASTVPSDNSGNYGSVWTDYNNDGNIDLYISKCRAGVNNPNDGRRLNLLFRNNGDGTFTDVALQAGLRPFAQSWAADFADLDNDGDMDCFVIAHDVLSMLFRNNGDGTFTDITLDSGIADALDALGPGIQCRFADFDNDGFMDLITTTVGLGYGLFHNNGDLTFTSQNNAFPGVSYIQSLATGDLNNDGFMDVMAAFAEGYNTPSSTLSDALFINNGNSNNYLKVRLNGVESNPNGIGARLELYGDWGVQLREVRSGESYGIMHSLTQHFGLGDLLAIDSLVVRWPSGIVDKIQDPSPNQTLVLTEGANCQPGFGFSFQGAGLEYTFSDQSTVAANTWTWDFGDGTTSEMESPVHTFQAAGAFTVCLTVSGSCGSGTVCETVHINCTPPDAIFGKTENDLTLSFQDQSLNDPVGWLWTFGDGGSSTEQNPVHVFPAPGDYFVCLVATNACGQDSETCSLITVACNSTEADFTFQADELSVAFTDASTADVESWQWNFGDSTTSTQVNPTHTFDLPGTYLVCLTVTGACGDETTCVLLTVSCPAPSLGLAVSGENLTYLLSATAPGATEFLWTIDSAGISTLPELVYAFPEPGNYEVCLQAGSVCGSTRECTSVTVTCPLPVAGFNYQSDGLTLSFTDQSTGQIDTWMWTFGDGASAQAPDIFHTYEAPGQYEICLTLASPCGETQFCSTVEVNCPAPQAGFTVETDELNAIFSNHTTGEAEVYQWTFGDGQGSTEAEPAHAYAAPGTYEVCLSVGSICGSTQICQEVTVTCTAPQALFSPSGIGLNQVFLDASSNSPTSWFWDFGDGNTSAEQNPFHVFAQAGNFNICLTASNVCGEDTHCQTVTVTPTPTLDPDLQQRITVAPNPAVSRFRLGMEDPPTGECMLAIVTPDGALARLIRKVRSNQEIDLEGLPAGMYFLHFTWEGGEFAVKKLVISR